MVESPVYMVSYRLYTLSTPFALIHSWTLTSYLQQRGTHLLGRTQVISNQQGDR